MTGKSSIMQRTLILVVLSIVFQLAWVVALDFVIAQADVSYAYKHMWTITLSIGMALSAGINISFAWFFSRDLRSSLLVLRHNIRNLSRRRPLLKPLEGTDELAQIDQEIHELAESLGIPKAQIGEQDWEETDLTT
jgi:hypothetical protein